MKNIIGYTLLLPFFISTAVFANNDGGIQFIPEETSFQQILENAKAENKVIFIDAYTKWCGPCKWMEKNVFTDPEVGTFFNEKFINAKFNMEKGEGIELAKRYAVMAYPALLFIDGNGEVVHRICGSTAAKTLLEKAKVALDSERNLKSLVTRYSNGNRDISFLHQYLEFGASACMNMEEIPNEYWSLMDKKHWASEENWSIFQNYVLDFESEQFQYLINNIDAFRSDEKRASEVDRYALKIMYFALARPIKEEDDKLLASNKKKIAQIDLFPAKKALILVGLVEYAKAKDWKKYFIEAEKYIETFGFDKPETVNDFSWEIYQNVDDKELLAKAAKWMSEMLQDEENKKFIYMDTHAALLNKSGNIEEGKKVSNEALELAKRKGENYQAEREIREAKAELERELPEISRKIEEATREGKQDKVDKLQQVRQEKISEYNKRVTEIKEKKAETTEKKD